MKLISTTLREAARTPGFSLLYLGGVAFTVAFTLVYGLLLYAQLGPVYPEYNRSNTVYVPTVVLKSTQFAMSTSLGLALIDEHMRGKLESVEDMTAVVAFNDGYPMVKPEGNRPEFHVEVRHTEPSFFRFYPYRFLAGAPFTQADLDSERPVATISDKVAARLYSSPEEAVGKYISIDHVDYRISGVFVEGSALCVDSYGEVFLPYTEKPNTTSKWPQNLGGSLNVMLHVKPGQEQKLRDEISDLCRRINLVDTAAMEFYLPLVVNHKEHILADPQVDWGDLKAEVSPARSPLEVYKPFLIAFAVVLVIPALNISGLIGARLDRRLPELAVRRCFGSTRRRLLMSVMAENMILTFAGALLGLVVAGVIVCFAGDTLVELTPLGYDWGAAPGTGASFVTSEMAFAPALFGLVLLVCLILNTISALWPVEKALRRPIVSSLNTKR